MNIFVLMKQIPVISDIKINPQTFKIDRSNAALTANPADLNALEAALQLKAQKGGTITVISMGNENVEVILREAAAMGADRFVRLTDDAFASADTLVTAKILASAIRYLGAPDAVFSGQFSLDSATGQIGGKLASMLDMAFLHSANRIEVIDNGLSVQRKAGPGYEVWQADFPVVCSVIEGANKPRSITVKGKMAAKKAMIEVLSNQELKISDANLVSPSIVEALFPVMQKETGLRITGKNEADSAKRLADLLFEKNLA